MYEEDLVEKHLDESAWADIRARRLERSSRDLNVALYGYLVGIENAMKAKKFAEYAREGQSIPSTFVKAYAPIVEMIDDFIEAGPSGIAKLKQVHKTLKK